MANKITIRMFLEAVQAGNNEEWVQEFARERINKLDEKNAKRSEKSSEKREENLRLLPTIYEAMGEATVTVAELKEKLEEEYTSPKLSALLKLGVEMGQVEKITPEKRHLPLGYKVIG